MYSDQILCDRLAHYNWFHFICCSTECIIAYASFFMNYLHYFAFFQEQDLHFFAIPVLMIAVFAFFIAHCFLTVYEVRWPAVRPDRPLIDHPVVWCCEPYVVPRWTHVVFSPRWSVWITACCRSCGINDVSVYFLVCGLTESAWVALLPHPRSPHLRLCLPHCTLLPLRLWGELFFFFFLSS
jgi:hypothetical protein